MKNIGEFGVITTSPDKTSYVPIETTAHVKQHASIDSILRVARLDATPDGMADDNYNGDIIKGLTFGENIAQWDTVCMASNGKLAQADANAAGEFPCMGIAIAAGVDTGAAVVLTKGIVRNEGWTGLTVGGLIYLSETAGGITQTSPAHAGDCVQVLGYALSDSEIYFDITPAFTLHA